MMTGPLAMSLSAVWLAGLNLPGNAPLPPPSESQVQEKPSETSLIENIKRLSPPGLPGPSDDRSVAVQLAAKQRLLSEIDTLLQLYPETSYKEDATITKLQTLAELARVHPGFLQELLRLTDLIAGENPKGRLGAENAYYAIQAFVLGARLDGMPEQRRLVGTAERYAAFLEDYPASPRVPVVHASLIRNLIALQRIDQARAEFDKLKRDHPDDKATRRAQGELYRVVAIGQPFSLAYRTSQGETVRTADHLGKVLLVHFWATWSKQSMEQLPELIGLYQRFEDKGLQLLGVNVDKDKKTFDTALREHKLPWPQYFDGKGFENDMLVATGVIEIPTYFVVDRKGILRGVGGREDPAGLVERLLSENPD